MGGSGTTRPEASARGPDLTSAPTIPSLILFLFYFSFRCPFLERQQNQTGQRMDIYVCVCARREANLQQQANLGRICVCLAGGRFRPANAGRMILLAPRIDQKRERERGTKPDPAAMVEMPRAANYIHTKPREYHEGIAAQEVSIGPRRVGSFSSRAPEPNMYDKLVLSNVTEGRGEILCSRFWGVQRPGTRRALEGVSSLLAFLPRKADMFQMQPCV